MRKITRLLTVILTVLSFACLYACGSPLTEEANTEGENVLTSAGESVEPSAGETGDEPESGTGDEPESETGEGAEANASEELAYYVRALVNGLNVRKGAGSGYASLGSLDKGDMVAYVGEEDGWYKTYYRGQVAYVSASSAYTELYSMKRAADGVESVIAEGCKLLGTPYVYGAVRYHNGSGKLLSGFTTEEFDCSSLMQYIFYTGAGVCLNLTTRTQIAQGSKVETGDLQRGDVMFFTNASRVNKTGVERVGHVALYLGDNYILHTASDYAVIEQISATRRSYFIQANRII